MIIYFNCLLKYYFPSFIAFFLIFFSTSYNNKLKGDFKYHSDFLFKFLLSWNVRQWRLMFMIKINVSRSVIFISWASSPLSFYIFLKAANLWQESFFHKEHQAHCEACKSSRIVMKHSCLISSLTFIHLNYCQHKFAFQLHLSQPPPRNKTNKAIKQSKVIKAKKNKMFFLCGNMLLLFYYNFHEIPTKSTTENRTTQAKRVSSWN